MGALANCKNVFVVDPDIDIFSDEQMDWAFATRFQADRDLVIVPESQGSKLDPSTRNGVGAKMGVYRQKTLDVGTFKPNAFGLYDIGDNVHEWCSDWYDPNYYAAFVLDPGDKLPPGLPAAGLGITNVVGRATARDDAALGEQLSTGIDQAVAFDLAGVASRAG